MTYLLFVLFSTAGIYFQLNYSFLGAVQLLIYAGGVVVLYVFSIDVYKRQSWPRTAYPSRPCPNPFVRRKSRAGKPGASEFVGSLR